MATSEIRSTPSKNQTPERRPKYQRVWDSLFADISSGRLALGAPLPTEAELSLAHGISRNTVRQALGKLEVEGLVRRVQGLGSFVTTHQQRRAKEQLEVFSLMVPEISSGMYPSLIHGFEQACGDFCHATLIGNSLGDVSRQGDLILQVIDHAMGGVALVPVISAATPPHQIRALQKNRIPVVFCHRVVEGFKAPSVIFSGREVGLSASRAFVAMGHRRIALLSLIRYSMTEQYEQGLRDGLSEAGHDPSGALYCDFGAEVEAPYTDVETEIKKTLKSVLEGPERPTAIFCGNVRDAEVVYLYALAQGLQIPRDLSLIYVGSTWREHGLSARITCASVDERAIGACAARLLHEMRTGARPIESDEQIVFPVVLAPGETVGPALEPR